MSPWTTAHQASLSITNSQSLPKLMSIESVMPSNHLILHRPLSFCLQSFPASGSFQMSQLLASSGQSIGVSASKSIPPQKTLKHSSVSVSVGVSGSWCIEGIFGPSECLWRIWGLILNMIFTLLPSCSGFSFALGSGVSPQNQQCRVGENEKKQ